VQRSTTALRVMKEAGYRSRPALVVEQAGGQATPQGRDPLHAGGQRRLAEAVVDCILPAARGRQFKPRTEPARGRRRSAYRQREASWTSGAVVVSEVSRARVPLPASAASGTHGRRCCGSGNPWRFAARPRPQSVLTRECRPVTAGKNPACHGVDGTIAGRCSSRATPAPGPALLWLHPARPSPVVAPSEGPSRSAGRRRPATSVARILLARRRAGGPAARQFAVAAEALQ